MTGDAILMHVYKILAFSYIGALHNVTTVLIVCQMM